MSKSLLIIEDDKNLLAYLREILISEGFTLQTLEDGIRAVEVVSEIRPDLVILDLGLPTVKGESVCLELKKEFADIPIIVLTGKDSVTDKVELLNLGADDYITKPFVAEELLARIKARLRGNFHKGEVLKVDDLELNSEAKEVKRGKKLITLTPQEFKLLEYLMANKGRVLSREMLLNKIWSSSFEIETRVVDVYISYLRKKIDGGSKKKLISSVRGFGYTIKD